MKTHKQNQGHLTKKFIPKYLSETPTVRNEHITAELIRQAEKARFINAELIKQAEKAAINPNETTIYLYPSDRIEALPQNLFIRRITINSEIPLYLIRDKLKEFGISGKGMLTHIEANQYVIFSNEVEDLGIIENPASIPFALENKTISNEVEDLGIIENPASIPFALENKTISSEVKNLEIIENPASIYFCLAPLIIREEINRHNYIKALEAIFILGYRRTHYPKLENKPNWNKKEKQTATRLWQLEKSEFCKTTAPTEIRKFQDYLKAGTGLNVGIDKINKTAITATR